MILREVFVELGLNVDTASFATADLAVRGIVFGLEKIVEAAHEAVAKVFEFVEETAEIEKTAQKVGLTTTALQELRGAAIETNIGVDTLDNALIKMSRTMFAAKSGSDEAKQAFHDLGLRATDVHGELKSTDQMIMELADAFKKLKDGPEKTALAMKVFSRSGANMLPMLNKGSAGIAEMREEAVVISKETLEEGVKTEELMKRLHREVRRFWVEIVSKMLPVLKSMIGFAIKAFQGLVNVFGFVRRNIAAIGTILAMLVIYFAVMEAEAIGAALAVAASWLMAAAPFIAIAAAIGLLLLIFDDLRVYMRGGDSLFGRFIKGLKDIFEAKPNEKDWFIVAQLKAFVRWVKEAIDGVKEIYRLFKNDPRDNDRRAGSSDAEIQRQADVQTLRTAKLRFAAGRRDLTDDEKAALGRQGVSEKSFTTTYGGGASAPRRTHNQQTNHIVVNAAPGQSAEDVAGAVRDKVNEHWQSQMEGAAASVPGQ